MRKLISTILFFSLIGILLLVKFVFFPGNKAENIKSNKSASKGGSTGLVSKDFVTGARIIPQTIHNTLNINGSLKANEEVDIQPEVSGKITALYFSEGTDVKKGQLLFKLNDLDLKATLRKLKFNLQLAQENEERQAKLLQINGISQQDFDIAKNTVESTKSDIEFTEASIQKTYVYAPFHGRIGLRSVSVGSLVTGSTKIANIEQIQPLKLDFSIPEQYATEVKKGDKIHFQVQGFDTPFDAIIEAIEPKIDLNTRTLTLRALYDNLSTHSLLPGTFVNVSLNIGSNSKALMVPTECLVPILKGQTLFIYHHGKVAQVEVETGLRTDIQVEIKKGLNPGDTIITTGLLGLKQNQEVILKEVKIGLK